MISRTTLLHLSLLPRVGPIAVKRLLTSLSPEQLPTLYEYSVTDFQRCLGCTPLLAQNLQEGLADRLLLEQELELLDRHGISWTSLLDKNYPPLLNEIYAPPPVLTYRGTLAMQPSLAVVGSRRANRYGQDVVNVMVPPLAQAGWPVVSGGALGIDTLAHDATVRAGGVTIVVLGSGLLRPYPLGNKKVFERVVASGGALISSFPLGMEALPGNFPARNRIIAGITAGTLVVQAAEKSGALITASYALEQGRTVMAVPGPIDDPLSKGCHYLISQGASLVESADDILQEFGQTMQANSHMEEASSTETSLTETQKVEMNKGSSVEDAVVYWCKKPRSTDELIGLLNISLPEAQSMLFALQLDGRVRQNLAGLWEA